MWTVFWSHIWELYGFYVSCISVGKEKREKKYLEGSPAVFFVCTWINLFWCWCVFCVIAIKFFLLFFFVFLPQKKKKNKEILFSIYLICLFFFFLSLPMSDPWTWFFSTDWPKFVINIKRFLFHLFVHSFIRSFTHLFVCLFVPFIHPVVCSFFFYANISANLFTFELEKNQKKRPNKKKKTNNKKDFILYFFFFFWNYQLFRILLCVLCISLLSFFIVQKKTKKKKIYFLPLVPVFFS